MSAVMRDKAWARMFARTGGDLGIRHVGPRIKLPIAIWKPQPAIPKRRVTVPSPQSRAATPDPLPADVDCTSACLVARRQVSTCKDLVPVVRVLRDDETGEVYEVAERHVEYPAPPF